MNDFWIFVFLQNVLLMFAQRFLLLMFLLVGEFLVSLFGYIEVTFTFWFSELLGILLMTAGGFMVNLPAPKASLDQNVPWHGSDWESKAQALTPQLSPMDSQISMSAEGDWRGRIAHRCLVHSDPCSFQTLGCRVKRVAFGMILSWELARGMDN